MVADAGAADVGAHIWLPPAARENLLLAAASAFARKLLVASRCRADACAPPTSGPEAAGIAVKGGVSEMPIACTPVLSSSIVASKGSVLVDVDDCSVTFAPPVPVIRRVRELLRLATLRPSDDRRLPLNLPRIKA